ncbi:elongator complex protein 3, partial [Patescibacteria group bacterium]
MNKTYIKLIKEAIKSGVSKPKKFLAFKKKFCSASKISQPTNADLREIYEELIKRRRFKRSNNLEKSMLSRAIRTQSGVAIIAVLTKPYPCPGKCLYCPTEKGMPKSYLSNEPAVMRAIMNKFNPYSQVQSRIKALELNGHNVDKIELIVMGGTFSFFPKAYQNKFISECFRACNNYPRSIKSKKNNLAKEQDRNEKSKYRIVGLTLETRPDYIDEKEILNFRNLGCTRVELGVQSIYDNVLKLNKRGHAIQKTIEATKLLKDAGFKINYHMMPGLLGSSYKKDVEMFRELFSNPSFQPDMLKIYPTVVVRNSALYNVWKKGKYKPLTDKKFEKMILEIKNSIIPPYVRIARLVRDVPTPSIIAGPKVSNIRQIIAAKSNCPCIRCREVRSEYSSRERIVLNRIDYDASGGREIFLEFTSPNKKKLFALLRLRIPGKNNGKHFIPALQNASIIREVHTYGKLVRIGRKEKDSPPATLSLTRRAGPQHIGLGKKMMREAEKITKEEFNLDKVVVISGIGVRDYYRKLG